MNDKKSILGWPMNLSNLFLNVLTYIMIKCLPLIVSLDLNLDILHRYAPLVLSRLWNITLARVVMSFSVLPISARLLTE